MTYILFLFFVIGGTKDIAITSAEFHNREQCEYAADQAKKVFETYNTNIRYLCIPK